MKTSRLLISTVLLIAFSTGAFAKCLKPSNFSQPLNLEPVDCQVVHEPAPPEGRSAVEDTREMVQITLDCSNLPQRFCDKVKLANKDVAGFITSTFLLREPITISMKFSELPALSLGGNVPGKFIPAEDSDQRIRLYTQALYKQFQFPQHPKYDDFDIHIELNRKILWHFPSDSPFMFASDNSFTWTALHEILHGMGFGSCWYHRRLALLPTLIVSGIGTSDCLVEVRECAYDRYLQTPLVLGDPPLWGPVSQFVHDYATYCSTENDLWEKFESSSSYQFGITLFEAVEIEGRFTLRIPNVDPIILETGDPYSPGRTLHHLEQAKYQDTEDFLMTPYAEPGIELKNKTERNKGAGPIGKLTVAVLNTMGYPTPGNPNPEKPKYIDPDT